MRCQILFSGRNEKNFTHLSSAELAQRMVKVKTDQSLETESEYSSLQIKIMYFLFFLRK